MWASKSCMAVGVEWDLESESLMENTGDAGTGQEGLPRLCLSQRNAGGHVSVPQLKRGICSDLYLAWNTTWHWNGMKGAVCKNVDPSPKRR